MESCWRPPEWMSTLPFREQWLVASPNPPVTWSSYAFSVEALWPEPRGKQKLKRQVVTLLVNVQEDNAGCEMFEVSVGGWKHISFQHHTDGTPGQRGIQHGDVSSAQEQWHDLTVFQRSGEIRLLIDRKEVCKYKTGWSGGLVGIVTYPGPRLRNVRILEISDQELGSRSLADLPLEFGADIAPPPTQTTH